MADEAETMTVAEGVAEVTNAAAPVADPLGARVVAALQACEKALATAYESRAAFIPQEDPQQGNAAFPMLTEKARVALGKAHAGAVQALAGLAEFSNILKAIKGDNK